MKTQNPPMTLSYKLILTLFSAAFAASLIACFFRFPATAGGIEGVAVWLLYLLYMVIAVARQANRLIIRTLLVLMTANVALAAVLLIYLALRPAANPYTTLFRSPALLCWDRSVSSRSPRTSPSISASINSSVSTRRFGTANAKSDTEIISSHIVTSYAI